MFKALIATVALLLAGGAHANQFFLGVTAFDLKRGSVSNDLFITYSPSGGAVEAQARLEMSPDRLGFWEVIPTNPGSAYVVDCVLINGVLLAQIHSVDGAPISGVSIPLCRFRIRADSDTAMGFFPPTYALIFNYVWAGNARGAGLPVNGSGAYVRIIR